MSESFHDRVLRMAEQLVAEHPRGREILARLLARATGDDVEAPRDPDEGAEGDAPREGRDPP